MPVFLELPAFTRLIDRGVLDDDDLWYLQMEIVDGFGEQIHGCPGLMRAPCGAGDFRNRHLLCVVYAQYPDKDLFVLIGALRRDCHFEFATDEALQLNDLKRQLDEEVRKYRG